MWSTATSSSGARAAQHGASDSALTCRPTRTHRRVVLLPPPLAAAHSHFELHGSPCPAPQHQQHPHPHQHAQRQATTAAAMPAESALQGPPQPALAPPLALVSGRLAKVVKRHRKQLQKQRPCVTASFVQDDVRGTEDAVVSQLLLELRRLELHQVAPAGDGCATLPLPPTTTTTSSLQQQQQRERKVQRAQVAFDDFGDSDPWGAGLDPSDALYAPRAYGVPGRVLVCQGSKCRAKGALGVLQAVSAVAAGSEGALQVLPCKCLGKCKQGAVVRVKQEGTAKCAVYTQLAPAQVPAILDAHFAAPHPALAAVAEAQEACCTDCKVPA